MGAALRRRDAQLGDAPDRDFEAYRDACRDRTQTARKAQRRSALEAALGTRTSLSMPPARQIANGRTRLPAHSLADKMGADATNDEAAAKALTAWQASHAERLHRAESALREWTELENILDGRSLADFESLVKPARAARNATEGLDPADIAAQIIDGDGRIQLETARRRAADDRTEADKLVGSVETESARLPSVPRGRGDTRRDNKELERVLRLDQTLAATLTLLRNAQEQVHRDIAPVLASTVQA